MRERWRERKKFEALLTLMALKDKLAHAHIDTQQARQKYENNVGKQRRQKKNKVRSR